MPLFCRFLNILTVSVTKFPLQKPANFYVASLASLNKSSEGIFIVVTPALALGSASKLGVFLCDRQGTE